jgi:type IV pilus assembly protein PilC
MDQFTYTARDAQGQSVTGSIAALTLDEAARLIRAQGKYPVSIKPGGLKADAPTKTMTRKGIKVSRAEVVQTSTQLSIMLETGVTLVEALECSAMNVEKPQLKKLLDDIVEQVNQGVDLSTALARHPRTFPRLFVAMIQAGEKSGQLPKMLTRAANYLKDEQEIVRKVKGAVTYPCIMLGFAVLTTIFLLVFVLPRFTSIYASKGAALPLPTKIMMGASDALIYNWMYLAPATAAVVMGIVFGVRTKQGARIRDWLLINVPLIKALFRKLNIARGLRTMGTMAGAGVGLVECVDTAKSLTTNSYYAELWEKVSKEIQTGRRFCEPLAESPLIPGAVTRMLSSGEKGGKLSFVMEQVAVFAEHELKEKIADLTRYIEPAMICFMGILIGSVTLALLLPIFTISKVVAH